MKQKAIIIGAGPAGLTAAYELLKQSDIIPIILESSNYIGGISKTVNHNGNRIDIGGHRFFSKSERVMKWWQNILPIQGSKSKDAILQDITYHQNTIKVELNPNGPDPEKTDRVMLIRSRLSRIFFLRSFFDYPINLDISTIKKLGFWRIFKIGITYIQVQVFPIKNIKSLEDFFISRFGLELYQTFFKDYTEKVWGVACSEISADWGAQRIKKLSISRALLHALKSLFINDKTINQKNTETSLIEQFMYPKLGPGQLWEVVAEAIIEMGGEIRMNCNVNEIELNDNKVRSVTYSSNDLKESTKLEGEYFFSTMPVKELIASINGVVPDQVREVSDGLVYRDFITVGLLLNKLKLKNETKTITLNGLIPDNWIYVQEKEVKLGRIQIFNNWSPYMVADINKVWIGLEYFCNVGDELWSKQDPEFIQFAIDELALIDIIDKEDLLDSTILRVPKSYPAYFGSFNQFQIIRNFTDQIENLFLVGRNGMHKYNNQDHSMLTAMTAVENIIKGVPGKKDNIWSINTEEDYHEEKSEN